MKLYELSDELRHLADRLTESEDGEIPDDLAEKLDSLTMDFEAKANGICQIRQSLCAELDAYETEIIRLTVMRDRAEKRAAWLRLYLMECMRAAGLEKVNTKLFHLRIAKNSRPSISLQPGAEIPDGFKRTKEEFDGTAAYEAWKAGRELPECVVVKQGEHLRIS